MNGDRLKVTRGRFLFFQTFSNLTEVFAERICFIGIIILKMKSFALELENINLIMFQNFLGLSPYSYSKLKLFDLLERSCFCLFCVFSGQPF